MKSLITLFTLFFSVFIFAQDFQFEEVVKIDSSITKDELFNRARTWANENFKSRNNITTTEDRESGEISGSGIYDYRTEEKYKGRACVEGPVKYKFNIYLKDGRYKYIFHSFDHKGSKGSGCRPVNYGIITKSEEAPAQGKGIQYNLGYADVKLKLNDHINRLIFSLKRTVTKQYEGSKDW